MDITYIETDYLAHHGVKGQRWGIRKYQNLDGTLTEAGKKRYAKMNLNQRAEKEFRKTLGSEEGILKERDRFKRWNQANSDWYFNEDKTKSESLKRKKDELEKDDPFEKVVDEVTKGVEKYYPNLNDLDRDMIFNAVNNVFELNIWNPALYPEKERVKSGIGKKVTDALIDVGKAVATSAITKTIVG